MKILDMAQGSPEWFAARAGVPSASNFDCVVTTKGETSKQVEKYAFQLAGEKILGTKEETYQNDAMKRGIMLEPEARLCYEVMTGNSVAQVGLCVADAGYACSPDGMVGTDGLVEIKCPTLAVHVSYLLDNAVPTAYIQQCQGQMLVTGRKWVDFVSYYPNMKALIVRVERDDAFCNKLHDALVLLVKNVGEIVSKIK
jgi:putative phage-type endonuclease